MATRASASTTTTKLSSPTPPKSAATAPSAARKPSQNHRRPRSRRRASAAPRRSSATRFTAARKSAPTAPTLALSVGVATPLTIDPSTATIRVIGGMSAVTTRPPSPARSSGVMVTGGQVSGATIARQIT